MYDITIRTEVDDTNLIRVQRYLVVAFNRGQALSRLATSLNLELSTLSRLATVDEWYTD